MGLSQILTPSWGGAEARLVQSARQGDRAAFDRLMRSHAGPLRGFLSRQVGPDAAEDVFQETWIAGWEALKTYRGQARFKAWLYAIARHKCLDYQRAQKRSAAEELSEATDGLPFQQDAFANADRVQAVRAALAGLPKPQQEVLELYFYAELTLPEIAETLERNLNTVKYQFYRAHAQAAHALKEYAP